MNCAQCHECYFRFVVIRLFCDCVNFFGKHKTVPDFKVRSGQTLQPCREATTPYNAEWYNADDTQLYLAMRADNTPAGLSVLAECTTDGITVVPAERFTAQPGQARSSDRRNDQSAACDDVIRVICVRGRSRPASSR